MIEYIPQLKQGNLPGYTPGDIPQSSNLMSTEEGKFFFFIKWYQRTLESKHPTQETARWMFTISPNFVKIFEG